ncbi:MAG: hypothetical protein HY059_09730 [Proteobacteria bacterium]|nr:hypothetical protein [Pseudomonadota bacterium]
MNGRPATQEQLEDLKITLMGAISSMSSDFRAEFKEIKSDIGTLKSDVGVLKSDVGVLKSDVGSLKSGQNTLAGYFSSHEGRLSRIEHILETKMATKDDLQRVIETVDRFSAKLDSYDRESVFIPQTLTAHETKLNDHDRRLRVVEKDRRPPPKRAR